MDFIIAIIYGAVQGITEFLPVSSSGHLVLLHEFLPLKVRNELLFDVVLHAATLIAVTYYFRRDIMLLTVSWLKSFTGQTDETGRAGWLIIIGTIPAAIAGYFFEDLIVGIFRSGAWVAIMLITVGLVFIIVEKYGMKKMKITDLNWQKALFIGCGQAIALIPGTSRSGITVAAGMARGLKREEAIKFSFLLSAPIIAGATVANLGGFANLDISPGEVAYAAAAFAAALICGLAAIKFFLRLAGSHSLVPFAIYRFALAAIVLIALYVA